MTTPPSRVYWDDPAGALRVLAQAMESPGLRPLLLQVADELDRLRAALKQYGTHAFNCLSEHGRYPARCSCGLREVLK